MKLSRPLLFGLAFTVGCVGTRTLPPRTMPERIMPTTTTAGRMAAALNDVPVVVDVLDGPTRVGRVTGMVDVPRVTSYTTHSYETRYEYSCRGSVCGSFPVTYVTDRTSTYNWTERVRTTEPVCATTPCAAHLPPGAQTLVFQGSSGESDATIDVVGTMLVRHALTLRHPGTDVWPATIAAWLLGGIAAAIGPAIATYEQSTLGADREPIGWGITAAGGGLILLGTLLLALNRETLVTPGSTGQWAIEL